MNKNSKKIAGDLIEFEGKKGRGDVPSAQLYYLIQKMLLFAFGTLCYFGLMPMGLKFVNRININIHRDVANSLKR